MINHYAYWYFKNIFDDKFCQKVIDLGLQEIDNLKKIKNLLTLPLTEKIYLKRKMTNDNH